MKKRSERFKRESVGAFFERFRFHRPSQFLNALPFFLIGLPGPPTLVPVLRLPPSPSLTRPLFRTPFPPCTSPAKGRRDAAYRLLIESERLLHRFSFRQACMPCHSLPIFPALQSSHCLSGRSGTLSISFSAHCVAAVVCLLPPATIFANVNLDAVSRVTDVGHD